MMKKTIFKKLMVLCTSATLAFGTPDERYKEARKQIAEMGDSFILAPSCTLPANMPAANIDALYAAIEDE